MANLPISQRGSGVVAGPPGSGLSPKLASLKINTNALASNINKNNGGSNPRHGNGSGSVASFVNSPRSLPPPDFASAEHDHMFKQSNLSNDGSNNLN
jgi:hypothetical protein